MKKLAIIIALLGALFLAACQPTPEVPPVVNKRESEEALTQSSEYAAPGGASSSAEAITQSINATPVEYEVSEHWKDEIVKNEKFKVEADVDVMVPKLEKFPVQKVERRDFTQEDIDGFIKYFVGDKDVKFYSWPLPQSKADFEAQLIELKKNLAQVEAGGDGEDPEYLKGYIKEVEAKLKNAPETPEIEYLDPVFTYQRDYETGKPYKKIGENFINLAYDDPETGNLCQFYASKYDEGRSYSNSISFSTGNSDEEYYYANTLKYLEQQEADLDRIEDENIRAEQKKYVEDERKRYDESMAAFAKNDMDIEAGKQKAIEILEAMGISGVQITESSRALVGPMDKTMWSGNYEWKQPTGNGVSYHFMRESGGLPCSNSSGSMYYGEEDKTPENTYSPPFYMEQGTIVLDEDYNIISFYWNDPAIATEVVSENAELLPFEQVVNRAVDQLFYNNTYYFNEDDNKYEDSTMILRFEVEEVKLTAAYINAKDDPNAALVIPVWKIKFQGYFKDDNPEWGTKGEEYTYNQDELLISAIDGSVVLPPMMNYPSEDMYSLEYEPGETPKPEATDAPAVEAPVAEAVMVG